MDQVDNNYSNQLQSDWESIQTPVPMWRRIVDVPIVYAPKVFKMIYQTLWNIVWRWLR